MMQNLVAEQLVGCRFNENIEPFNWLAPLIITDWKAYPSTVWWCCWIRWCRLELYATWTLLFGRLESIAPVPAVRNTDLKILWIGNCYYFDDKKNPGKRCWLLTEAIIWAYGWPSRKVLVNSWAHPDETVQTCWTETYVENILKTLGTGFAQSGCG